MTKASSDYPLVLENLSFRYRDRQELAIQDISLKVAAGELLLVAGASGCGKTTLIRSINGLVPRSYKGELNGQVLLYGEDTIKWSIAQISQVVGTVLQDPERQILGTLVFNEVAFGLENMADPVSLPQARLCAYRLCVPDVHHLPSTLPLWLWKIFRSPLPDQLNQNTVNSKPVTAALTPVLRPLRANGKNQPNELALRTITHRSGTYPFR